MHNDEAAIIRHNVWKPHNKTFCTQQMMADMEERGGGKDRNK